MKKILLIFLGCLCTTLGVIGIFLPVLPTTPFILVGSICFVNSSPKLYNLLIKNRYLGVYIVHYREKTGIPVGVKVKSLIILWIGLIFSMVMIAKPIIYAVLSIIGICVTIHILSIKAYKGIEIKDDFN